MLFNQKKLGIYILTERLGLVPVTYSSNMSFNVISALQEKTYLYVTNKVLKTEFLYFLLCFKMKRRKYVDSVNIQPETA